ncbi:hypothetical protein Dsin_025955 [Dipteronia sinensis]|uniref:DUF629 domain-containing protein n=1 Tax=Dipteronia sinensis TaxID=43782 RepID=A0AAD9ZWN3_9ROSI|nr:hypothetical protein Dsin_025955 [Dipteronia sinensis]
MESDSKKSEIECETLLKRQEDLQKFWNSLTDLKKKEFKRVKVSELKEHVLGTSADSAGNESLRLLTASADLRVIAEAMDKKTWKAWKCFNCKNKDFYDLKTLKDHVHNTHWDFEKLRGVLQSTPRVEEIVDHGLLIAFNDGYFSLNKSLEHDAFVGWLFTKEKIKGSKEVEEAYLQMIEIHNLYKQKIASMKPSDPKKDILEHIDAIQKVERDILKSSKDCKYQIFLEPKVKSCLKEKLEMELNRFNHNAIKISDLKEWIEKTGGNKNIKKKSKKKYTAQSGVCAAADESNADQSGVCAAADEANADQSGVCASADETNADQSGVCAAADEANADQSGVCAAADESNADQSGVCAAADDANADQSAKAQIGVCAAANEAKADDEAKVEIGALTTYSDPFGWTDLLAHARSMFLNQDFE